MMVNKGEAVKSKRFFLPLESMHARSIFPAEGGNPMRCGRACGDVAGACAAAGGRAEAGVPADRQLAAGGRRAGGGR